MNKKELNRLAKIELEHIQIELKHKRGSHIRHFIDQDFCFKYGYVTKNWNPRWEDLVRKGAVSEKALNSKNRKEIVKEHLVPLKYIKQVLLALPDKKISSLSLLEKELKKIVKFGTIHKSENKKLNKMGLRSKMPEEYFNRKHELHNDLYARYKIAEIKFVEVSF